MIWMKAMQMRIDEFKTGLCFLCKYPMTREEEEE